MQIHCGVKGYQRYQNGSIRHYYRESLFTGTPCIAVCPIGKWCTVHMRRASGIKSIVSRSAQSASVTQTTYHTVVMATSTCAVQTYDTGYDYHLLDAYFARSAV